MQNKLPDSSLIRPTPEPTPQRRNRTIDMTICNDIDSLIKDNALREMALDYEDSSGISYEFQLAYLREELNDLNIADIAVQTQFTKWLATLCDEGEIALVVKQHEYMFCYYLSQKNEIDEQLKIIELLVDAKKREYENNDII